MQRILISESRKLTMQIERKNDEVLIQVPANTDLTGL